MSDNSKDWLSKAEIDYFSPFVSLWLACNSWYNYHYPEKGQTDRERINIIKDDKTKRNHLRRKFKELLQETNPDATSFRSNLEQFSRALDEAGIHEKGNGELVCFDNALYSSGAPRESLIVKIKKTTTGKLRKKDANRVIDLGTLTVTSDKDKLFAGVFEMIYQVRCNLVHGSLEPSKQNHTVVKYAYQLLWDLMHF